MINLLYLLCSRAGRPPARLRARLAEHEQEQATAMDRIEEARKDLARQEQERAGGTPSSTGAQ
eukprot:1284317-Alexandrium_andersonii.AAC.1